MSPSYWPLRALVITGLIFGVVVFWAVKGNLTWQSHRPACLSGYHWNGEWHTVVSYKNVVLRFHDFSCPAVEQYDPSTYTKGTTIYVPTQ